MSVMQLLGAIAVGKKDEAGARGEGALVERLRRADPAALGAVYDQHHAAVRAFARRLIGETAAAEDLVHEVFVSLPGAARHFEGNASLRTFLISIAVNHARHHLRAAARNRAAMARFAEEPGAAVQDPEDLALRASLARALAHAMDALPIEQRVAFVLFEVDGYTAREAAEITGAPEATVRTRVFHARQKLRALLEQQGIR